MSKLSGADHILGASVLTNYKSPENALDSIDDLRNVLFNTANYYYFAFKVDDIYYDKSNGLRNR